MLTTFDEIIEVTLHHEGGYVHDPKDLGGETNYGIAKRFYPDVDIKNLTKEGAKEIYKKDYWDKNKVDDLTPELKHIFHFATRHFNFRNFTFRRGAESNFRHAKV